MAKGIEEILEAMRTSPQNVRFADVCKVLDHFFGEPRQLGTSHRVWKMPWLGDPRVNVQNDRGKAKSYQVKQAVVAIDNLLALGAPPAERTESPGAEPMGEGERGGEHAHVRGRGRKKSKKGRR